MLLAVQLLWVWQVELEEACWWGCALLPVIAMVRTRLLYLCISIPAVGMSFSLCLRLGDHASVSPVLRADHVLSHLTPATPASSGRSWELWSCEGKQALRVRVEAMSAALFFCLKWWPPANLLIPLCWVTGFSHSEYQLLRKECSLHLFASLGLRECCFLSFPRPLVRCHLHGYPPPPPLFFYLLPSRLLARSHSRTFRRFNVHISPCVCMLSRDSSVELQMFKWL